MKAMPEPAIAPRALERDLLRFLTCGSVDDGKSTLIGRLLFDSKLILEDQLATLSTDSKTFGTTGDDLDLALLMDGLEAEREQGITIDIAYRFFTTTNRSFIVADAPGHEQYTRNMATGASACDLAVILVDARNGVRTQTRRHSYICSLLGIRHVVLAVNKMDLVDYAKDTFERIADDYATFAADLGFHSLTPIPISARHGDNVTRHLGNMPWYQGPTVIAHLESIDVATDLAARPFRFAVQWVSRPDADFRGFAGVVASGVTRPGDPVLVNGTGRTARVGGIHTADGARAAAAPGEAVTLTLDEEIDIARGDLLASPDAPPQTADQLAAHILWMSQEPLLPGRSYRMRIGNRWVTATVTGLKHRVDVNTLDHIAARDLGLNEIAFCNLATSTPITFDAYEDNRDTGGFILVDRFTNETCAAGLIRFALRRATNVRRETLSISKAERAALKRQTPAILWFTGLSGSGKSTIARLVEKRLHDEGAHTYMLDGDNVRLGLNRDIGFTDADRVENIRRIGEVAKLFVDSGLIVLCSFISPFRAERQMVRGLVDEDEFIEVFVDTPIEECIRRDPKGLYAKARAGEISNFTGIDSPYERPENAQIVISTADTSAKLAAERIVDYFSRRGIVDG